MIFLYFPSVDSSPCVCFTRACIESSSFKFGELTTVNDAWCRDAGTRPAQRANVTFTLHSFPNFTTWLYVVKIDIGNWCVHTKGAKYRSEKVSRTETFSAESESLSFVLSPAYRQISKIFIPNIILE